MGTGAHGSLDKTFPGVGTHGVSTIIFKRQRKTYENAYGVSDTFVYCFGRLTDILDQHTQGSAQSNIILSLPCLRVPAFCWLWDPSKWPVVTVTA